MGERLDSRGDSLEEGRCGEGDAEILPPQADEDWSDFPASAVVARKNDDSERRDGHA